MPGAHSTGWAALAALLSILFGAAGLADAGSPPLRAAAPAVVADDADAAAVVFLARRTWHIDMGLATGDLEPALAPVAKRFPGARYLFFGFGDLHYLLARHRSGPVMLEALWPGRALVLVTGLTATPAEAFGAEQVLALRVDARQLHALEQFIASSLAAAPRAAADASQPGGSAPELPAYAPGPYAGSAYYLATARYSAVHTCNTWIAEALRAAGLPVHSRGVLFASQLWREARRLPQAQRQGG